MLLFAIANIIWDTFFLVWDMVFFGSTLVQHKWPDPLLFWFLAWVQFMLLWYWVSRAARRMDVLPWLGIRSPDPLVPCLCHPMWQRIRRHIGNRNRNNSWRSFE